MDKNNIMINFGKESRRIIKNMKKMDVINFYYEDTLEGKYTISKDLANDVWSRYEILKQYHEEMDSFLGNEIYIKLVSSKEGKDAGFDQTVKYIIENKAKYSVLLANFESIIERNPIIFKDYIKNNMQSYNKYESCIRRQFEESNRFKKGKNYTSSDLIHWIISQKEIGAGLIKQLNVYEKSHNIKIAEMHKGLQDSLLITNKKYSLITPFNIEKSEHNEANIIPGSLVYDKTSGLCIKNNLKTLSVPEDINTLLLFNPYNQEDTKSLVSAINNYNIIYSVFGLTTDSDYNEKTKQYYKVLDEVASKSSNIEENSSFHDKQYVKTIYSKKNLK